jgi:hypothetical protein
MTESEFRRAVQELLAQSVEGLSVQEQRAILEDAFKKQVTKHVPPVSAWIFHSHWHWWLAIGLAFLGANGTYAALEGTSEWIRILTWWVVFGVLCGSLIQAIKFVVMRAISRSRPGTAGPGAAADRGRHSGFAPQEGVAGGPGS